LESGNLPIRERGSKEIKLISPEAFIELCKNQIPIPQKFNKFFFTKNNQSAFSVGDFKKPKIVVILGPNASGKSDLAVLIAKKFNGEIISADSRQVYKGMDIGTGKVPRDNKKLIKI